MIHSSRFTVVLDACVLYPAPVRDILLHLAHVDLYMPKWTTAIQDEWRRNLLENRPDLTINQLNKTIRTMDKSFPDANVINYQSLINALRLPDNNDRHVLAAAVRCHAEVIVTYNLKDFPARLLKVFDIEAQHPDVFICNLIGLAPELAVEAFQTQLSFLKNPPLKAEQVLASFKKAGLASTSEKLGHLIH